MMTVGIIGAGRIGQVHAENIKGMRNVHLKSVSDLYIDTIGPWAKGLGIENITNDYKEILNDRDIDAVLICSPTNMHVPMIKEAAMQGKHVFCEKPLSFDMEATQDALAVVKKCKVKLQIGFNRRFDVNFKQVRDQVAEGVIGDVHIIKITSRDPAPPSPEYIRSSGGIFMDMSIHDFDMARYIVGDEVEEVYAQGDVFISPVCKEVGDVDTAIITLKFQKGAMAVIDNSRKAVYGYDQRLEVFGERGCISVDNVLPTTARVSISAGVYKDKPHYFFLERYQAAYVEELESFFNVIRCNHSPCVTGEDGYQAERIAHAAKRSLEENRPVKVCPTSEQSVRKFKGSEFDELLC